MKLTSLNLQGFEQWDERFPRIVDYLRAEDPDVIMFQEVVYLPGISAYNQVQLLNETLGYTAMQNVVTRLQVGLTTPVYREGLGVLSKFPIVESESSVLKQDPRDEHERFVQFFDIAVQGLVMKMANVHYSITDYFDLASPQLRETLDILEDRSEWRLIMGDYNLDDLGDFADWWQDGYDSTARFDYMSYPDFHGEPRRRTYALVPPPHTVESLTTSADDLSDHLAVTITIR